MSGRDIHQQEKLKRIARQKQRVDMSLAEARARARRLDEEGGTWGEAQGRSRAWPWAWPLVKTWAMEVEANARLSEQSCGVVWTRKEAEVWARARKVWGGGEQAWAQAWAQEEGPVWKKALVWVEGRAEALVAAGKLALVPRAAQEEAEVRKEMRGEAIAMAEALALAGVWIWARSEARARESIPFGLADSSTIWRILCYRQYSRFARRRERETSDEECIKDFIAPITRLPFELLREIFRIIIDKASGPPSALMLVCERWHAIVTSMWAPLNLGTTTPIDAVKRTLERGQWLDIVVDTNSDHDNFTPLDSHFEAIFAAIEAGSRWRSLVVESFPALTDLAPDVVNRCLQQCPNVSMSQLTTFKIKSACQTSPLFDSLLRILSTTARALTTVEINSANAISFLAPVYPSIFRSVKILSLNTPGIPNSVDLLPHLHQLERFTASHIPFPIYHEDVNLPFIHTLCHLSLRAVSIQWMSGRTFHVLENCSLIFPLHHHVLHMSGTTLPNCTHLVFQGYPLDILSGVSAPKLSHLSVTCSRSSNGQGNRQLMQFSRQVLGASRPRPRILHIGIEAANKAWMSALAFMSDLEELVIHSAQPSSLGEKVFWSFVVQPVSASHLGASSTHEELCAPLCPSLRRFGLKYDRWLRSSEQFDLIPVFMSIIRSRRQSNYALESLNLWRRSTKKTPLELIEQSHISTKGFKRLAQKSGNEGYPFDFTPIELMKARFRPFECVLPSSLGRNELLMPPTSPRNSRRRPLFTG